MTTGNRCGVSSNSSAASTTAASGRSDRALADPRGRVDAGPGFALCSGSTYQPRHREILLELARLPFVERIVRRVYE